MQKRNCEVTDLETDKSIASEQKEMCTARDLEIIN